MKKIDDYDLFDQDFDEFIRRGMEELLPFEPTKEELNDGE